MKISREILLFWIFSSAYTPANLQLKYPLIVVECSTWKCDDFICCRRCHSLPYIPDGERDLSWCLRDDDDVVIILAQVPHHPSFYFMECVNAKYVPVALANAKRLLWRIRKVATRYSVCTSPVAFYTNISGARGRAWLTQETLPVPGTLSYSTVGCCYYKDKDEQVETVIFMTKVTQTAFRGKAIPVGAISDCTSTHRRLHD